CHKRARPIVMTTIAMGCGMLPVALSLSGGDPSFRQPMAIVVIGGLMTSTVLSLVAIPVIFTFVDDFLELLKRLFGERQPKPSPASASEDRGRFEAQLQAEPPREAPPPGSGLREPVAASSWTVSPTDGRSLPAVKQQARGD
ncbi:efflux RND transporter permease subunit, partial [Mesorhizobium sp.]|uniref:efflux RND transporter permease subunit n=1 Tax=Mesorhizobium sp. TaxID=1871066 RepID=UPI0025C149C6